MPEPIPPPPPGSPTRELPRRVGGRYRLLAEVGRGGMATVHRAHDEVLDRAVAVKLLHSHLATDPAFLDRFRREARAAAALTHPNVVAVHDWGETDDGAYLVLQLVDGPTLRDVLRHHGRLSPREALAVLGPAAAGLAAAHEAGLVHRDVKPENVLIGQDGTVRVTDFGLARAAAASTQTFGSDVLVGSPHYLSPEAVQGDPLDARADVYALGIVLYECLTGRPPHEADTPFATAVAHTSRPVPRPSDSLPGLAPAIDDIVLRTTARDRDQRTPDAATFGQLLSAAVVGGPAALPIVTSDDPGDDHRPGAPTWTTDEVEAGLTPIDPATDHLGARVATAVVPVEDGDTAILDGGHGDTDVVAAPRRRRRVPRWVMVLLLLVTLLGASAAGGYLLWDRVIAPVTPIPNVLGASESAALAELTAAGFVPTVAGDRVHDLEVPEGHVLVQDREGSARVGTGVRLVLSAGPRQVEVPDLVGSTADEALTALRGVGLSGATEERYDEQVELGRVIATSPARGEVVDEGTQVGIVVSLGREPREVPALAGATVEGATASLRELDLELAIVDRRFDDAAPAGTIIGQDPDPGTSLFRGEVVEVVVSDGPQPIEVPGLRGELEADAVATLRSLGFDVEVERRGGFGAFLNPGRVFDQDPAPGTRLDRGATVLLYAYES
jgi:eukaryotic-like serine/threonine-protein kinase